MKKTAILLALLLMVSGLAAQADSPRSTGEVTPLLGAQEDSGLSFVATSPAFLVGSDTSGANAYAVEHMLNCGSGNICMTVCEYVLGFCWACVADPNPNVSCPYFECYSQSCNPDELQWGDGSSSLDLE